MSDFTKEELENILNGNITLYPHTHGKLVNKIQSMIDNYCAHDGVIGKDFPGEKCMKCNRMWE